MPNAVIIIVGGGKFGIKAIEFAKKERFRIIIIDRDSKCEASNIADQTIFCDTPDFQLQKDDFFEHSKTYLYISSQGIKFLFELLQNINPVKYIIPTVPVHLIAELVQAFLFHQKILLEINENGVREFTQYCDKNLLLGQNYQNGVVYLSYAQHNELCPDNCLGPLDYCPSFKREKPIAITQYLKEFYKIEDILEIKHHIIPQIIIIVESKQLKAGLGGIKGNDIIRIFQEVKDKLNFLKEDFEVVISTTCNCHGVISFFKRAKN